MVIQWFVLVGTLQNCKELLYICTLPSHQYNLEFCKISARRYMLEVEFYVKQFSLAVMIVSLININNWPYLGINNFQLMHQIRTLA